MGPILQYLVGVPFGLFCLFGGIIGAIGAFGNKWKEDKNNGFWSGIAFLVCAAFGWFILKAILFDGLHFSGPGRYG